MSLQAALMEPSTPTVGRGARWQGLGTRAAASAVMMPLALAAAWFGGIWFALLLAAIGLLMAREWCAIVHAGSRWQLLLHAVAALAAALLPFPLALLAAFTSWLGSGMAVLRGGRFGRPWRWLGVPYVALPILALTVLRADVAFGLVAVIWLLAAVWTADVGAYFAGRLIGGPKLAPRISPNKTWAGLGGAVAGAGLAAGIIAWAAELPGLAVLVALGVAVGVVEQLGDLFESAAKRSFGVKDSGALIPGHGGVLDRVDGLVFASVAAATLGIWRGGLDHAAGGFLAW